MKYKLDNHEFIEPVAKCDGSLHLIIVVFQSLYSPIREMKCRNIDGVNCRFTQVNVMTDLAERHICCAQFENLCSHLGMFDCLLQSIFIDRAGAPTLMTDSTDVARLFHTTDSNMLSLCDFKSVLFRDFDFSIK